MVVHGHAALPDKGPALRVPQALRRDDLLGADEVPVEGGGLAGGQGAEALPADLQAVVDDHLRLEGADHVYQLSCLPGFAPELVIGEVKPQDVQLAVAGAQLPDLVVEIFQVAVEVPPLVSVIGVIPHGVVGVAAVGEVRVPPVDEGEVQPCLQSPGPGRLQVLPDEVPARGGVGGLEIRVGAVVEAEAIVVLGGHDHVPHPRRLGHVHPFPHVAVHGVELMEIGVIRFAGNPLRTADPLPPGGDGVEPPVNEHAEPCLGVPGHTLLVVLPHKLICHACFPPVRYSHRQARRQIFSSISPLPTLYPLLA